MPIEQAFFKDIQSEGGVNTLLIYADWLEENGRQAEAVYARKRSRSRHVASSQCIQRSAPGVCTGCADDYGYGNGNDFGFGDGFSGNYGHGADYGCGNGEDNHYGYSCSHHIGYNIQTITISRMMAFGSGYMFGYGFTWANGYGYGYGESE